MSEFRKKPVVINAHRIGIDAWPDYAWEKVMSNQITLHDCGEPDGYILIQTLEGEMKGNHGDYLIKGVQGEFYPCKPDIFESTYEAVV